MEQYMALQKIHLPLALHPKLNVGARQPFIQLHAETLPNKPLKSFKRPATLGPHRAVQYVPRPKFQQAAELITNSQADILILKILQCVHQCRQTRAMEVSQITSDCVHTPPHHCAIRIY